MLAGGRRWRVGAALVLAIACQGCAGAGESAEEFRQRFDERSAYSLNWANRLTTETDGIRQDCQEYPAGCTSAVIGVRDVGDALRLAIGNRADAADFAPVIAGLDRMDDRHAAYVGAGCEQLSLGGQATNPSLRWNQCVEAAYSVVTAAQEVQSALVDSLQLVRPSR